MPRHARADELRAYARGEATRYYVHTRYGDAAAGRYDIDACRRATQEREIDAPAADTLPPPACQMLPRCRACVCAAPRCACERLRRQPAIAGYAMPLPP